MDRWTVYDLLKQCRPLTDTEIDAIENTTAKEVKEGLLEWLTVLKYDKYHQSKLREVQNEHQRRI